MARDIKAEITMRLSHAIGLVFEILCIIAGIWFTIRNWQPADGLTFADYSGPFLLVLSVVSIWLLIRDIRKDQRRARERHLQG